MIEDSALRELFRVESQEYLEQLDDGLLRLEQAPADGALLDTVFRVTHNLKGAARMLGLSAVQGLAHDFEDGLVGARDGREPLTREGLAHLTRLLGALRERLAEALGHAEPPDQPAAQSPVPAAAPAPAPAQAPTPAAAFRIDTVRVEPRHLDTLMNQASELRVAGARVAGRLTALEALRGQLERALAVRGHAGDDPALAWLEPLREDLKRVCDGAAEDGARLGNAAEQLQDRIRTLRLLPLGQLFQHFPRYVHELSEHYGKPAELIVEGDDTAADKRVLEQLRDPLMHLLRNAIAHGLESPTQRAQAGKPAAGVIRLRAEPRAGRVMVEVSDDGRGLDLDAVRAAAVGRGLIEPEAAAGLTPEQVRDLVFVPGLSTATRVDELSGRGVGLDVVRSSIEAIKGSLAVESVPGAGCRFRLEVPVSLATARLLLVQVGRHPYGLPVEQVRATRLLADSDLFALEGRQSLTHDGVPLPVIALARLFGAEAAAEAADERRSCVIMDCGGETFGLLVDSLVDEQEAVLRPAGALLQQAPMVAATTLLAGGEVCLVLQPRELLSRARAGQPLTAEAASAAGVTQARRILLADDSIVTRTQMARILTAAGYEVVTAVDGMDAWWKLPTRAFDAVVSDVDMPRLNGLELTAKVRAEAAYADLPVVLVTSLGSDADKQRGLEAGASAYLVKTTFDQQTLLDCLEQFL